MPLLRILLLLFWATPVWAQDAIPVKITADSMQYAQKNDEVVFSGNVHVLRQDMELWSETLTVLLEKQQAEAKKSSIDQRGSIKKILAKGNVRMTAANNRSGSCGLATYDAHAETLVLEQDPVLREGPNTIQGDVIKLYIKENRSEVLGGKKRVEAIFVTPDRTLSMP
ncbi:LptA/OstA family protein [Desulfovibrionales bacterium]